MWYVDREHANGSPVIHRAGASSIEVGRPVRYDNIHDLGAAHMQYNIGRVPDAKSIELSN